MDRTDVVQAFWPILIIQTILIIDLNEKFVLTSTLTCVLSIPMSVGQSVLGFAPAQNRPLLVDNEIGLLD